MYARHVVFGEDRRAFEEGRFWFQDGLHAAEPLYPFDSFVFEYAVVAMNQSISRLFVAPTSLGHECRLLNGYIYLSANPVTDEATLERRTELFAGRSGYYYEHWNELYEGWLEKVEAATTELAGLEVPEMPEVEDESIVTDGRGLGSSHALLHAYDRLLEGVDRIFQYHFEFLLLGYGAYLAFYEQCRERFPDISDQTIAKMVSGYRCARPAPRRGASAARTTRSRARRVRDSRRRRGRARARREPRRQRCRRTVARRLRADQGPVVLLLLRDRRLPPPPPLVDRRHQAPGPERSAPTSRDSTPARTSRFLARLRSPSVSASPRGTARCSRRSYARPSTRASRSPARCSPTSRTITSTSTTATSRSSGTRCASSVRSWRAIGFLGDGEDVFLLRHDEVRSALEELRLDWSSGGAGVARGPLVWPPLVERRRAIYDAMYAWAQPPALGPLHEEITDPITIMLWGITDERVRDWLSSDGDAVRDTDRVPGIPRGGRGLGARAAAGGPARRARGRRDPGRAGHLAELDAGLPPDRRQPSSTPAGSCAMRRSSPGSTGCRRSSERARGPSGSGRATGCASMPRGSRDDPRLGLGVCSGGRWGCLGGHDHHVARVERRGDRSRPDGGLEKALEQPSPLIRGLLGPRCRDREDHPEPAERQRARRNGAWPQA